MLNQNYCKMQFCGTCHKAIIPPNSLANIVDYCRCVKVQRAASTEASAQPSEPQGRVAPPMLTDERIGDLYRESFNAMIGRLREAPRYIPPTVISFARAIEADLAGGWGEGRYRGDKASCAAPAEQASDSVDTPELLGRMVVWAMAPDGEQDAEYRGIINYINAKIAAARRVGRKPIKLRPEIKEAIKKASETRSTAAELPDGGVVFINYGDQPEDTAHLCCTACGGSGHIEDQRENEARSAGGEAVRDGWSKEPPTEQAWYWHWWGDTDQAPFPVDVLYSGTAKKCFVAMTSTSSGQAEFCDTYGGYWKRIHVPDWSAAPSADNGEGKS